MASLLNVGRGLVDKLPYDAEIEYLQSSGTTDFYIDTGIGSPSSFASVEIQTKVQFITTSGRQIHGALNALYFGVNNDRWECIYNGYNGSANTQINIISKKMTISGTNKNVIVTVNGAFMFNRTDIYTQSDFSSNIGIFNYRASSDIGLYAKIYSEKIYINGEVVRDYIPVRVGTTGYMYDKVTKQLFGNAGTGTFILGPDKTN